MGFFDFLKKAVPRSGAGDFGSKVVEIDNTSPNDNWITNKSGAPVSVACEEMWGSFAVHLGSGETKRVTYDVNANAYPAGEYSYDDLKYELGRGEKWEVGREQEALFMRKVSG